MTTTTFSNNDRQRAIELADDQCERCGWLAWSTTRAAQLEIREREVDTKRLHVFCPTCATKFDDRQAKRNARVRRSTPEEA